VGSKRALIVDTSGMADTAKTSRFAGFPPETFSWLAGLEADNSKKYFRARRATYDRDVRGALEALLDELTDEVGGRVKMFRQHRDVRFSIDKSPYKTSTYGVIHDRGESLAPLYAQLSTAGLFAGTGYYVLAGDQLSRFREAVAEDVTGIELERAIAIAHAAGIEIFGEALKTAPRGYPRDHPRLRLLRHRSLIAGHRLSPRRTGIDRYAALSHARGTWIACGPLNAWLDSNVGASELPPVTRYRGAS
jgi:uncharacterized protein (TIGR02453 family)